MRRLEEARLLAPAALLLLFLGPKEIVSQSAPPTIRIDPSPSVQIGRAGDPHYEFNRIASVVRLSDGSVAVVCIGDNDVRVFDRAGAYVRSLGREGSGPGEYQQVHFVGRAGDTLVLYDFGLRRLTRLDVPTGRVATKVLTPATAQSVFPVALLEDGTLVLRENPVTSLRRPNGTRRDSVRIYVMAEGSDRVRSVGRFAGDAMFAFNPDDAASARSVMAHPLGPRLHIGVSEDRVLVVDGANPSVSWFEGDGKSMGNSLLPVVPQAFSEAKVEDARARLLNTGVPPREHDLVAELFHEESRDRMQPAFASLHVATNGDLWIAEFTPDVVAGPTKYTVINSRGELIGTGTLPENFRVTEIGSDYVLGVRTDADRVESVELYRYTR